MSFYSKPITYITILAMSGLAFSAANAKENTASHKAMPMPASDLAVLPAAPKVLTPDMINWMPGSNSLPAGSKVAVIEGDPAQEGPFILRIKFPANYVNAPHTHPKAEHMTVISGTFNLGIGQKFDKTKGTAMPAGSFVSIQPGVPHYGWGSEETVLQIHGIGPREKVLVNPTDNL
jgi:quercetin dioxygenase-like cupin family protein